MNGIIAMLFLAQFELLRRYPAYSVQFLFPYNRTKRRIRSAILFGHLFTQLLALLSRESMRDFYISCEAHVLRHSMVSGAHN